MAAATSAPDKSAATTNPCDLISSAPDTSGVSCGSASCAPRAVEQLALQAGRAGLGGNVLELVERLVGGNGLQRSRAAVPNTDPGIARHALDERVVHREALRGERQKRAPQPLEVGHEHARSRLGRSQTRTTAIEERDRRAADCQLVRDGRANNPCPDDRDVTISHAPH